MHCSTEGKDILCVGWWTVKCSERQQSQCFAVWLQAVCFLPCRFSKRAGASLAGANQVHTCSMLLILVHVCGSDWWVLCKQVRGKCMTTYMVVLQCIWLLRNISVLLTGHVMLQSSNHDRRSSPVVRCGWLCCRNLCCTLCKQTQPAVSHIWVSQSCQCTCNPTRQTLIRTSTLWPTQSILHSCAC